MCTGEGRAGRAQAAPPAPGAGSATEPELAVHTQLQTSHCFIGVQMSNFRGFKRDINPQQNHSSLVHLFDEAGTKSWFFLPLVTTKHRQQGVTQTIYPILIQMNYRARFKSLPVQITQDFFFSKIQVKKTRRMWFSSMSKPKVQVVTSVPLSCSSLPSKLPALV